MKGVMRVGDLAKGLILSNNLNVELVVLCTEKPTKVMLSKVHSLLPAKLKVTHELQSEYVTGGKFSMMIYNAFYTYNICATRTQEAMIQGSNHYSVFVGQYTSPPRMMSQT